MLHKRKTTNIEETYSAHSYNKNTINNNVVTNRLYKISEVVEKSK